MVRQRLCLRATTNYWVYAIDGRPFFVVNQVVEKLCEELNATEAVFPSKNLRLVLKLGST